MFTVKSLISKRQKNLLLLGGLHTSLLMALFAASNIKDKHYLIAVLLFSPFIAYVSLVIHMVKRQIQQNKDIMIKISEELTIEIPHLKEL